MLSRSRQNLIKYTDKYGTYKVDVTKQDLKDAKRWCTLCEGRYVTHLAEPILIGPDSLGNVELCRPCVEELGTESAALKGIYLLR